MIAEYSEYPEEIQFQTHCKNYTPFLSHNLKLNGPAIIQHLLSSNKIVDVSANDCGVEFNGNPSKREKVNIKMNDFAAAFAAEEEGIEHWINTTGLNLYLSQCSIYSDEASYQCDIPELIDHIGIPTVLIKTPSLLSQINLWMNVHKAVSTLHYDGNHNILVLMKGIKKVTLIPPNCTQYIQAVPAYNEYPNHSFMDNVAVDSFTNKTNLKQSLVKRNFNCNDTILVSMQAGDALFIPEGWWHQVKSDKCTMAINYWFSSSIKEIVYASDIYFNCGTQNNVTNDNTQNIAADAVVNKSIELTRVQQATQSGPAIDMAPYLLRTVFYRLLQQYEEKEFYSYQQKQQIHDRADQPICSAYLRTPLSTIASDATVAVNNNIDITQDAYRQCSNIITTTDKYERQQVKRRKILNDITLLDNTDLAASTNIKHCSKNNSYNSSNISHSNNNHTAYFAVTTDAANPSSSSLQEQRRFSHFANYIDAILHEQQTHRSETDTTTCGSCIDKSVRNPNNNNNNTTTTVTKNNKRIASRNENYTCTSDIVDASASIVTTITSNDDEGVRCRHWNGFVNCSQLDVLRLWIPYAAKNPDKWTRLLLSMPPYAAHYLLTLWDQWTSSSQPPPPQQQQPYPSNIAAASHSNQLHSTGVITDWDDFFNGIFNPCGDAVTEVRQFLIAQKDKHRETYAKRILKDVLGFEF